MQPVIRKTTLASNVAFRPDIPKGPGGAISSGQALLLPEWRKQSLVFQSGNYGSAPEGSPGLIGAAGGAGPR